jgi:serine/threonine-protein kinase
MQASEQAPNQSELHSKDTHGSGAAEPADVFDLPLPRRFERYILLKRLARGGMGEVLLAASGGIEGAERPVVVKTIRKEHESDRSFLARFLDEARIQAQLQHPGVAQILEATSDAEGKPFVVVEHIEGRNLSDVRARAGQLGVRISWPEAVALGVMLSEALAHVHERTDAEGRPLEIVHRDLSPQNVMISYGGELKLIDFGTARAENRRCHTVAGIVFAKPGYVAPEVANNTPGAAPSDLYAFGIMLWELLAGRRFLIGDAAQHMALVGAGKRNPAPLAQLIGAPSELDAIVQRLTATRIEDRFASAAKAAAELGRVLQRAPSMADGDRSVRGRVESLMRRLYPAEPARSRAEFARLVAEFRATQARPLPIPASPEPPPTETPDESLLGGTRYRLEQEIGRGSMGIVYAALHLDLSRKVALKLMDPDRLSPAAVDRFRAEARSIAQLSHDNLIKVYDYGVARDGRPFYAMELLEGESLERRMAREGELSYRSALEIGIQVCSALEIAHAAGVVHRDVKPGNLLVTSEGVVKLFDFGVAYEPGCVLTSGAENVCAYGTPEYMAPEQTSSGSADARSDLYALGAVIYELLTGYQPHVAAGLPELIELKRRAPVLPPSSRRPEARIPKALDALLVRVLDPDPAVRPQSARELREAFVKLLNEPAPAPERHSMRRRALAFTLSASLSALVIGIGTAALLKTQGAERAVAEVRGALAHLAKLRADALARSQALGAEAPAAPRAPETVPAAALAAGASLDGEIAEPTPELELDQHDSDEGEVAELEAAPFGESPEITIAGAGSPSSTEGTALGTSGAQAFGTPEVMTEDPAIARASALWQKGARVRALGVLRDASKKSPNDAALHRALAGRAEQLSAWGEAVKAARRWALLDPTPESRVALARLERATGHRDRALALLEGVIQDDPADSRALTLRDAMLGSKLALSSE